MPWLSLAVSLPAMCSARLRLPIPETLSCGEAQLAAMELECPFPAPGLTGKLRVTHTITGQCKILKIGKALPTELCGALLIEPVRPRILDYLGLFRLPVRKPPELRVCIWPEILPVLHPPAFAIQPPQRWKPKPGGGFAENHELRLYRPGDSLQQIHWKLSAKTGKLILREAMEPIRQPVRLTLDLNGSQEELNRKLGRLLWLGRLLTDRQMPWLLSALTGQGVLNWQICSEDQFSSAVKALLQAPAADEGTLLDATGLSGRLYHIGGAPDEE